MYRLISFIGEDDADILPFFLEHYRRLGVGEFHVFTHGAWSGPELAPLRAPDVVIAEQITHPYSDVFKSARIEDYARKFKGEWIVFADADEFLELPFASLPRTIAALCCLGLDELPARLLQRASADGSLPVLCGGVEGLFPAYDYLLAERMIGGGPIWKNKYPLARIGNSFSFRKGNHLPHNGRPSAHVAVRAVVHHFKWRDRVRRSVLRVRGEGSNQHEQEGYLRWFDENGFRVPTTGLRRYSREAMFRAGFLTRPSRLQLARTAALRKMRQSPALTRRAPPTLLDAPHAWRQENDRAAAYMDRGSLALKPGRVALVTDDFAGLNASGGIGTAMAATAERLVAAGHDVHLFFCRRTILPLEPRQKAVWEARGITIREIPWRSDSSTRIPPDEFILNLSRVLDELEWDVMHFQDIGGYAAAVLLERAAGLRHHRAQVIVAMHGPSPWTRPGNHLPWTRDEALRTELEAICVRLADVVLCPSRYILDWCQRNYPTTAPHILIPNSLIAETRSFRAAPRTAKRVNEIVFFGRVEVRKGIETFFSAVQAVLDSGFNGFRVVLLGSVGSSYSLEEIVARTAEWPCRVQLISNHNNREAVDYLRTNDCVVVVPSDVDNLPYTVYECLENGIPIIASNAGGIPELVANEDRARILVSGGYRDYAEKLIQALQHGIAPAALSFDPDLADLDLIALHARMVEHARAWRPPTPQPASGKVTVIAYGSNDTGAGSSDAVLRRWREDGHEVLNGAEESVQALADGHVAGTLLEMTDGETCNRLSRRASSALLLFCHATVTPALGSLEALVRALESGDADAAVCGFRGVDDDGAYDVPAYAGPPELSADSDIYGARFFLIRKDALLACGGFDEETQLSSITHWEFLNRLRAEGSRIVGVPTAMAMVRLPPAPMPLTRYQAARLAAPWIRHSPPHLRGFLRMGLVAEGGARPSDATAAQADHDDPLPPWSEDIPGPQTHIVESAADALGADFMILDALLADPQIHALREMCEEQPQAFVDMTGQGERTAHVSQLADSNPEAAMIIADVMRRAKQQIRGFYGLSCEIEPEPARISVASTDFTWSSENRQAELKDMHRPDFHCEILLNDDFEGGQLYFTSLDVVVQPAKGRLAAWTASNHHRYAIRPVVIGDRLALQFGFRLRLFDAGEMRGERR